MSLWHKIFGSPAEQTSKVVDEPSDEIGSPSDLRNEPRAAGAGFSDAHSDEQMQMFEGGEEEGRSGEEEGSSDRPRSRSRRRGRGRGRGRKSDDRPSEGRGQRGEQSRVERAQPDLEDEFSDEELMDDQGSDVAFDDDDGDDLDDGVASGASISRSTALARSIPSWEEAITFIVDSNMQSRSQRRPPQRSGGGGGGGGSRENGSRGGRGRGRGRGRS